MRWGVIADRLDVPKFHDSLATSHARYYDCIMTYGINVLLMQQYIIVLYVRCTYGWCWSPVTTITSRFINTMNLTSIQSVHTTQPSTATSTLCRFVQEAYRTAHARQHTI